MEQIKINTGLESFVMPEQITQITKKTIKAIKSFDKNNLKFSLKLETLAQVCALHTRYATDFGRHAFLLKIDSYTEASIQGIYGNYELSGKLTAAGKSAFAYTISAYKDDKVMFRAEILIAVTDYDETFTKEELSKHYRGIFSCLTTNIQKS